MRLPFFRSSKAEPTKAANAVVAPPRPAARNQLAETQLIVPEGEAGKSPSRAELAKPRFGNETHLDSSTLSAGDSPSIPIPLKSIVSQLPAQLISPTAQDQANNATIQVPADWILSQVATGKVVLPMARLLPLLPQTSIRNPLPVFNSLHPITLPLEVVVTALPTDLLKNQNQSTLDIDTPEFDRLPKLFDDDELAQVAEPERKGAEQIPAEAESVTPSRTVEKDTTPPTHSMLRPKPSLPPLPQTVRASQESGSSTSQPAGDNQVFVSLRSLVAVMPDYVFACSRTELWRRIDLETRVPLPCEILLPQLQLARIRIPLTVAVEAMPRSILAAPLPPLGDETVPLALQEIVSQLPPQLFASTATQSDEETLDFSESEIPMPFQEKLLTSPDQAGDIAVPAEPKVSESLDHDVEATDEQFEAGPKVFEITTDDGADEDLPIFAEKAVSDEPVSPSKPEPVVEPTAEVQESVAEVQIVEPTSDAPTETSEAEVVTTSPVAEPAETIEVPPPIAEVTTPTEPMAEVPATPAPAQEALAPEVMHQAETREQTPPVPEAPSRETQFLVNLNNCTAEDLAKVEGIGPVLAQRIIEFRNARGGFKSLKDLRYIPGINRKTLREFAAPAPRALNRLLGVEHNEELTLQEVVRLTSQLKGVSGCTLAMSDGVLLTAQLPPQFDQETISVFAPQLFKKVARYTKELRVGQVTRLSVFTDQQPLSIFRAGDIFLVIVHDPRHFSKALLRRCERISQEIARLCRQRAVV